MRTAAEVKRQKAEAAQKKAARDSEFQMNTRKGYMEKMQAEDSVYGKNMQNLAELEKEERVMVEVLN